MLDKGYDREVLEDNVVVFRARSATRQAVDKWYEDVAMVFAQALAQGTQARLMYDLRNIDMVTPYGLQRAEELDKLPLPEDWRVATLVSNVFVANVANYVISVSMLPAMRNKSRVFADEAEALTWLRE